MSNPCYTCRRRHIQCDRSKTPCVKCQKAGLECLDKRPLRWVKGVAARGHMQGVSMEDAASKAVAAKAEQMTLPAELGDTLMAGLDRVSKFYLDYYNERICKLFIVYDSDRNPFRNLIPLALNDPILQKAVLALAAQHKANGSSSGRLTDAHHNALAYKHRAIHGLSQTVQDVSLCRKDTTVASIFLLIFLDLLESGSDRWNVHIEGAKSLIALLNQPLGQGDNPGQTMQEIRNFIAEQIYLIETLGATFVRPRLLSQIAPPVMQPQDTLEQSFLGCPGYLLNSIQYLSHQRDAIAGLDTLNTDIGILCRIQDLTATLDSIRNFDCHLWVSSLPHQSPTHDIHHLSALSTAYKLGAQIYGQRVLDALTNERTPQDTLVAELLRVIASLRDDPFLFKCILWPMCIAAVECPRPAQAQRQFLTGCMEKFWRDTKCLNAVNAARILQRYWEWEGEGEGRWIFEVGILDGDWLLV